MDTTKGFVARSVSVCDFCWTRTVSVLRMSYLSERWGHPNPMAATLLAAIVVALLRCCTHLTQLHLFCFVRAGR